MPGCEQCELCPLTATADVPKGERDPIDPRAGRCVQVEDACVGIIWRGRAELPWPWIALLSSRISRFYSPDHWWLCRLRHAVSEAERRRATLLAVRHTTTAAWLAAIAPFLTVPVCFIDVVYPAAAVLHNSKKVRPRSRQDDSALVQAMAWFRGKPTSVPLRDYVLWTLADVRFVLHVRPRGSVERLCVDHDWAACERFDQADPDGEQGGQEVSSNPDSGGLPAVFDVRQLPGERFLFHWTRAQTRGWPDESDVMRYRRLVLGTDDYTALAALRRIARHRVLHAGASGRGRGVVSLTAVHPAEWPQLRVYRRHRGRWDFEPYGLAVSRRLALAQGACPVVYTALPGRAFRHAWVQPDDDRYGWHREEEWRVEAPLDLSTAGPGELVFIVPSRSEAVSLARFAAVPCAYYDG